MGNPGEGEKGAQARGAQERRALACAAARAAEKGAAAGGVLARAGRALAGAAARAAEKGVRELYPGAVPLPVRLRDGWGLVREVRGSDGARVRVLQVGGVYQSATYLDERRMEPVFSYYRAFDLAFAASGDAGDGAGVRAGGGTCGAVAGAEAANADGAGTAEGSRRVLMVGGGGYAWPKHVLASGPADCVMDVVELDPAVTRVAGRWFFLDEAMEAHPGRLRLVEGDGRSYLEGRALRMTGAGAGAQGCHADVRGRGVAGRGAGAAGRSATPLHAYDAIVLDAFCGAAPVRSLATLEAARAAKACLVPGGRLLANVVSEQGGTDVSFLRDVVATWREAFSHVYVVACEEEPFALEDNYLVIATDGDWPAPDAIPYDEEFLGTVMRD